MIANLRSLLYSAGVTNDHSWYSQNGQESTAPAISAAFRRSVRIENGVVASSWHDAGSEPKICTRGGTSTAQ